jgi:ATP-dependent DNA ligase
MRCGHNAGARRQWLFVFDLIEQDGDSPRDLTLIERKRRLAKPVHSL